MYMVWCSLCIVSALGEGQLVPKDDTKDQVAESAKFETPESWVLKERAVRGGPGGTAWDSVYRSLIQTTLKAEEKGFPGHDDAVRQIVADAQKSVKNLDKHLYWTLFIKHFSSRY